MFYQTTVSSWACSVKIPGCEENAIDMFNDWMRTDRPDENNPYVVPPSAVRSPPSAMESLYTHVLICKNLTFHLPFVYF